MDYQKGNFFVNLVLAGTNCMAVLIALFKESFFSWRNRPILSIDAEDEKLLVERSKNISNGDNENGGGNGTYDVVFRLANKGKGDARNVKLQITNALFIDQKNDNRVQIKIENEKVQLDERNSQTLSPSTTMKVTLLSLSCTQRQQSTGEKKEKNYEMKIGENLIEAKYHVGTIKIEFSISCDGGYPPLKASVSMKWDGKWKDEISDISTKHLEATIEVGEV